MTETEAEEPAPQEQAPPEPQPADPAPPPLIAVAPAVLPASTGGRGGSVRPATPAKPATLRMPQPPAYSRFG